MQSRYPGIRSFETNESSLFFGRQRETKELYNLIKVKRFVVLFSKSGIGKTSLLNAGVLPLLTQEEYFPVKVRFQNAGVDPTQMLLDAVKKQVQLEGLEQKVAETLRFFVGDRPPTLWEYLKACSFEQNDLPAIPLFVFDQFEEFFLHSPEAQKPFIDGISDILFERVPEPVQEAMRQIPRRQRTELHLAWATPLGWKIVFAIRSDRLSFLDNLSRYIPIILDNRYQLHPLDKNQAREAVVAPAALEGNDFSTPPFAYQDHTLDKMLQSLSNEKGEVESFQLQILCEHIERQIMERKAVPPIMVTADYLDKSGDITEGVQNILNSYYERRITALGEQDAKAAIRLIEEGLIMNGVRISLPPKVIQDTFGISEALLSKIMETRIIRAEVSHTGLVYEVSHDTLVAPIVESYERRMELERIEKQKREKELFDLQLKRKNRVITGFGALVVLMVLAAIFAFIQWRSAAKAKDEAEKAKNEADNKRQEAETARDSTQKVLSKLEIETENVKKEYIKSQLNLNMVFISTNQKDYVKSILKDLKGTYGGLLDKVLEEDKTFAPLRPLMQDL